MRAHASARLRIPNLHPGRCAGALRQMFLQHAIEILRRIEDWLLAILVLILVVLAGGQIVLRDFFHTGISWADPLMRQLVLWTGMLGALAAVRDEKHIALDVLQRFLSP